MGPDIPADAPRVAEGRYALLRRLGEGGMAVVYAAWDAELEIWRAVKVLLPDYARRGSVRRRFEREARTMMSIRHPNLVSVHEVRADSVLPFLVMDLVPGGSLEDWIVRHGVMPPRLAAEFALEMIAGLVAVHEAGVVHRDIKPQNVLIDDTGVCKLTDFGVARVEGGETRTGVSMGTLGYMAPEQFEDSKSADARSDVYSVGATLYVLLTKRPVQDLLRLDEKQAFAILPDPLRPVVAKCLEYEREDRYPDAPTLLTELARARDALPPIPDGVPRLARTQTDQLPGGSPGEYTELQGLLTRSLPPTDEHPRPPSPRSADARVALRPPPERSPRGDGTLRAVVQVEPTLAEPTMAPDTPAPPPRQPTSGANRVVPRPPPSAASGMITVRLPTPPAGVRLPSPQAGVRLPQPPPAPTPARGVQRQSGMSWLSAALGTLASAFAVALGTVTVISIGVPLALATGRASVVAAQEDVTDAREILLERIQQPAQLEEDLATLAKAPSAAPPQSPPDEERLRYAETLASRARPLLLGHRADGDEELARQRLERVVWAVDRLDAARDRWRAAANDPLGRLAINLGLADPPT